MQDSPQDTFTLRGDVWQSENLALRFGMEMAMGTSLLRFSRNTECVIAMKKEIVSLQPITAQRKITSGEF